MRYRTHTTPRHKPSRTCRPSSPSTDHRPAACWSEGRPRSLRHPGRRSRCTATGSHRTCRCYIHLLLGSSSWKSNPEGGCNQVQLPLPPRARSPHRSRHPWSTRCCHREGRPSRRRRRRACRRQLPRGRRNRRAFPRSQQTARRSSGPVRPGAFLGTYPPERRRQTQAIEHLIQRTLPSAFCGRKDGTDTKARRFGAAPFVSPIAIG